MKFTLPSHRITKTACCISILLLVVRFESMFGYSFLVIVNYVKSEYNNYKTWDTSFVTAWFTYIKPFHDRQFEKYVEEHLSIVGQEMDTFVANLPSATEEQKRYHKYIQDEWTRHKIQNGTWSAFVTCCRFYQRKV